MKEIIMGKIEVNQPDILLATRTAPNYLSLAYNASVKIDVNVYNNTIRNANNS